MTGTALIAMRSPILDARRIGIIYLAGWNFASSPVCASTSCRVLAIASCRLILVLQILKSSSLRSSR